MLKYFLFHFSGFTCSGSPCYLIYPTRGGWKYKDTNGNINNAGDNVYTSPNCYKYIRVNKNDRSCIDAQRECEQLGGNIAEINSIDEYEQLTESVLHILRPGQDSIFSVHIQNPSFNIISKGCATIIVKDGNLFINEVSITNTKCATTRMVDTFVCESTDVHTGICPKLQPTTPVHQTSHIWSRPVTQFFVTDKTISGYTPTEFTHSSKETLSEMKVGPSLRIVAVVMSSVVVTIAMILLSFFFIRRRQRTKKPGNGKAVDKVEYQDYVAEGTHEYATHNAVVQHQKTTADKVVYQDVEDNNAYDDTAVEMVYHDTAVEVLYQNSDVDRSKRTGNRKGFAHVIVGRQNSPLFSSIRALESREREKGSEFQFSEDYSEIDACMPNANKRTEPNIYLQIIG
ncbi:uncharacterized protein LOC117107335 [Anneissia japonica]|uniref:uncharacterized protein LOC117107335 n=1 Tax=Anneissia japonica TaxID=1529436 RepID=UPI0014254DCE|nr:uncharacterized protein LOC117107335 [Anneissia japonica]